MQRPSSSRLSLELPGRGVFMRGDLFQKHPAGFLHLIDPNGSHMPTSRPITDKNGKNKAHIPSDSLNKGILRWKQRGKNKTHWIQQMSQHLSNPFSFFQRQRSSRFQILALPPSSSWFSLGKLHNLSVL